MSGVLRIAAVGVTAALCALFLKKQTPELALTLAMAAGCMMLGFALGWVEQVTEFLGELGDTAGLSPAVLSPVLKVVGIALVSRWTSELCRDAGEGGLAVLVETAASALALLVCVPLLKSVLSTITGLI